jgi:short-subunit dehydrogenase
LITIESEYRKRYKFDFFLFIGNVAIFTGASRGLGRHMARALAQAGVNLVVTSRTLESLSTTKMEIESFGSKVLSITLDIRQHSDILPVTGKTK